jgi:acyl carrier protein
VSSADVPARLIEWFAGTLHRDVPTSDTDLFASGVLDSLAFADLLVLLEREFGTVTTLEDMDLEHFQTIDRIAAFVASRTARFA